MRGEIRIRICGNRFFWNLSEVNAPALAFVTDLKKYPVFFTIFLSVFNSRSCFDDPIILMILAFFFG